MSGGFNYRRKLHLPAWSEDAKTGCWVWLRSRDRDYGILSLSPEDSDIHGHRIRAHRLMYERAYGPIPDGMVVRHKCDNPPCVNPEHLEVGTHADNVRDMMERGRHNPAVGERAKGAKLTEAMVREIRAWRECGFGMLEIGRAYGVSDQCVSHVVNRTRWRHVE